MPGLRVSGTVRVSSATIGKRNKYLMNPNKVVFLGGERFSRIVLASSSSAVLSCCLNQVEPRYHFANSSKDTDDRLPLSKHVSIAIS